jgi:hypothetical protein
VIVEMCVNGGKMRKSRISKTAQVNLMMLADLEIDEAVRF